MSELNTLVLRDRLDADVTYNNDDTLNDTVLGGPVEAGEEYIIRVILHGTNPTRSLNFDFGGTATISEFKGVWKSFEPGSVTLAATKVTSAATDYNNSALDAGEEYYEFDGSMKVNAAGTFILRAAQRTAHASDTILQDGSSVILFKIP